MKKLLTILGSLTIAAGSSVSVVSCGSNSNEDNDRGSLFLDANGELRLTAEELMAWYQENIGMGDNVQRLKEFFQLFAVAILKESEKGDDSLLNEIAPNPNDHQYALEDFKTKVKDIWGNPNPKSLGTVQGQAYADFNKKVEDKKRQDGENNWEKNMVNDLAKTFPYVNKNFEALKKAWINNEILTNKTTGALAQLTNVLWNKKGSSTPTYIDNKTNKSFSISQFVDDWKTTSTVQTLEKDIITFLTNADKKNDKYLHLVNLINATGGKSIIADGSSNKDWSLNTVQWLTNADDDTIDTNLIHDLLQRLDSNKSSADPDSSTITSDKFQGNQKVSQWWNYTKPNGDKLDPSDTFFSLISYYPQPDFKSKGLNGQEGVYGFLTNAQRFLVDAYFQEQKPVSINEIVLKKAESGDLTKNIQGSSIINPKADAYATSWRQYYGFYSFLTNYVMENAGGQNDTRGINNPIKGSSQYNFDTIFGSERYQTDNPNKIVLKGEDANNRYWEKEYFDAKNDEKLLTLSDTDAEHNNITQYSVYDFIQATKDNGSGHSPITKYQLKTTSISPVPPTRLAITNDLVDNWGYNPQSADAIATSIANGAPAEKQNQVLAGLYATLNLIKDLNRKMENNQEYSSSENQTNNKVYQVLNSKQGIIAFVGEDGLHITKINGYDILLNPSIGQQTNIFTNNRANEYVNESIAFKRLKAYDQEDETGAYRYIYQDYQNNIKADLGESDDFTKLLVHPSTLTNIKEYGVHYQDLNAAISNPYERFLVNNSILSSSSGRIHDKFPPFYKFDLLKNVEAAIGFGNDSTDKLNANNSWLWDYMKKLLKLDSETLLTKFFKFEDTTASSDMKDWYVQKLDLNSNRSVDNPRVAFKDNWVKWHNDINDKKDSNPTVNRDLPLMKLAFGKLTSDWKPVEGDTSHINNLWEMHTFDPFQGYTQKFSFFSFKLNILNYTEYFINLNKKGRGE